MLWQEEKEEVKAEVEEAKRPNPFKGIPRKAWCPFMAEPGKVSHPSPRTRGEGVLRGDLLPRSAPPPSGVLGSSIACLWRCIPAAGIRCRVEGVGIWGGLTAAVPVSALARCWRHQPSRSEQSIDFQR